MTERVDVGDRLTPGRKHRRHVHPDPAAAMARNETPPSQRRRQALGEPDPISQQPDRYHPGQRHNTLTVSGD